MPCFLCRLNSGIKLKNNILHTISSFINKLDFIMRKILLSLLFLALFVPWTTKTNAQCNNNVDMCPVTVYMQDSYGDGWNGSTLEIYQGSTLRGSATLTAGSSGSVDIAVCPESIQLVWATPRFSDECSFVVVDGTGDTLYQAARNSLTNDATTLATVVPSCPSCIKPTNFAVTSSTSSDITLSWQGSSSATEYEIVYGPAGSDPDLLYANTLGDNVISGITGQTTTVTDLRGGVLYDFFIRSYCGSSEYSAWTSLQNVTLMLHTMTMNAIDTIRTCGAVICDDGGLLGDYGNSYTSTLYLYPNTADSVIRISGTLNSDQGYDFLYIYEGIGTSGTLLFSGSGNMTIESVISELGPATIVFSASNNYGSDQGFVLSATCAEAPVCPRTGPVRVTSLSSTNATIAWEDPNWSYAYEIEYGVGDFEIGSGTFVNWADLEYNITGLQPNTEYTAHVRIECPQGGYSSAQSVRFRTTNCDPIYALPLVQTFENNSVDSCWTILQEGTYGVEISGNNIEFDAYYGYAAIVSPELGEPVGALKVSFNLKKAYSSDPANVEVGVMGNPRDMSTFVQLGTASGESNSYWNRATVFLYEYDGIGQYVAIRVSDGNSVVYIDSIAIDFLPACSAPNNLRMVNVGPNSAICRWEAGTVGTPEQYNVGIAVHGTDNWSSETVSTPYYSFNNLDINTIYDVRVEPLCNGETEYATISFNTLGCTGPGVVDPNVPANRVFVGDSSYSGDYNMNIPIRTYEKYNYTQQLFTADELEGIGTISGVSFKKIDNNTDLTRNISIYMATTTKTDLTAGFISDADFVLVYSGSHTFTNGWNRINFTDPFPYGGAGNVVLAVKDSTPSADGIVYLYFSTHYTDGKMALCANNSHSSYDSIPNGGTTPSYSDYLRNNVFFYYYPCDTAAVSCAAPLVTVIDVNATNATVAWAAGAAEESWMVEYKKESDTVWTVAEASTTEMRHVFIGLDVNNTYQVRISSLCTTDTMHTVVSFTTTCGKISTLPFEENFDDVAIAINSLPACWYGYNHSQSVTQGFPKVTNFYGYGNRGQSLRLHSFQYSGNADSTFLYVTLPEIDVNRRPLSNLRIEFDMFKADEYYEEFAIIVGVMTDPTDSATFRPVDTVFISSNYVWQGAEVLFNNYHGNGSHIALMSRPFHGENTNDVYVDNIKVSLIPNCLRPTDVVANNVAASTADIMWAATSASSYIVEYGVSGFQLGNGTRVTTSTNSISLSGLTVATNYDVYVYGLCGSDTSQHSFPISFYTNCGTISTFPYFEDFNSWANSGLQVPQCWTPGNDRRPELDTYVNYQGSGASLYMYTDDYATEKTIVSMPQINSQVPVNSLQVSFKLYGETDDYGSGVIVGVSNSPADINSFVALDTFYSSNYTWQNCELALDGYAGNGKYITFVACYEEAPDVWYYDNYAFIDNILVEVIPTCRRPDNLVATNVTETTAELSWNHTATNASYIIEYGPVGFQLGSGTIITTTSNPYTLTGLTPTTSYEYYVRVACSIVDSSEYSTDGCRFATSQVPAAIPYAYDFENVTEWNNWQTNNNQSSVNWYRGTAAASQGSYSIYVSNNNGTSIGSIHSANVNATAYRDFDFGTTDTSCILSFSAKVGHFNTLYSSDYCALAIVLEDPARILENSNSGFTSPWGNINSNNVNVLSIINLDDTAWHNYDIVLDHVSGVKRLGFYWCNKLSSYYQLTDAAAIDNITIDYIACLRPSNLEGTAYATRADLSWTGSASEYLLHYRTSLDSTYRTISTTSNTYTLTNLVPGGTTYTWAVQAICGADTSMMSEPATFSTECFNGTISSFPFVENFEGTIDCWSQSYGSGADFEDWALDTEIDDAGAYNGNKFAKYQVYDYDFAHTMLISPVLNLSAVTNPYMVYAHIQPAWESDQDTLGVYYRVNPDSAWVYLASYSNNIDAWTVDTVSLPNKSNSYQVGFLAQSNWGRGVGIDGIIITGVDPSCPDPILSVNVVMNSATIMWDETGDYEIKYKKADEATYGDVISVTDAISYQLNDLYPNTDYVCDVRRNCGDADGFSNWTRITFTTGDLPCATPTNIVVSNITYTSASINWTAEEGQNSWEFSCTSDGVNITLTTDTTFVALTDIYAGQTYQVKVRAYCGVGVYSQWSEVSTFNTTACESVSNVNATNITGSSATIAWTPAAGQTKWQILYGLQGVDEEHGTSIIVEGNPAYTIEGLESDATYDLYIRNICADGIYSPWTEKYQFNTTVGINTAVADNVNVNIYPNPANTEATIAVEGINGKVEFAVADMNGRMIVTETINCEGQLVKTIDVSNLAKGAYFVHIYNDNFNTTRKLIVK